MPLYREPINLGDNLINLRDKDFITDVKNNLCNFGEYMAIIDEDGNVYGIKAQAHQQARNELIKTKENKNETIIGFYKNPISAISASTFYNADKDDMTYSAIFITYKQMMAMYNLCLLYGDDIVEMLAKYSANMGFSYDDTDIKSIIGYNPNIDKLLENMDKARAHNMPIFERVTGIPKVELNRAIKEECDNIMGGGY